MGTGALPDLDSLDREALIALLIEQRAAQALREAERNSLVSELEAKKRELAEQGRVLLTSTEYIDHLKLQIAKLRQMLFGKKSEKIAIEVDQLEQHLEEVEAARAELDAVLEEASPASVLSVKPGRMPLPEHLPREVITYEVNSDCCTGCGGELRKFGEDVSEQIEYIPESFKVIRHVRPKYACKDCDRMVEAPAPGRAIERGLAGPGLLAHVLVSKYCDHLPRYGQSEIYARQSVDLGRSTLASWVGASSDLLYPLLEELCRHVFAGGKLHADDTPIPVLEPGRGRTKTGRLWTYVRDDRPYGEATPPAVWFAYSEDRKGEHPRIHLKNF